MPSFSIILCVNRGNPWLAHAIQSVLEQDDPDFEFLIAANACSDDLWREVQSLTSTDGRVRLYRTGIGQLAYNLNFLADQAIGDYLVRMDADDVSEPMRIRTLRNALFEHPVDILGTAVTLIDDTGRIVGRSDFPLTQVDIIRALPTRTSFCHPAVVIRKQFLLDMRGYLGGFVSEDTDFWLRAKRAGGSFRNLPEALLRYRIHPQQSTAGNAGYAEVASHWLRELLLKPSLFTLKGFAVALAKCVVSPWLTKMRRRKDSSQR